ncbi:SMC family ATPase [Bacillus sp. MCCB 382]|uniref:AAA family ATPase n=1 Tax=Bacillus sp. MCCB 382 TaxID=2860197 RepID=UPI001C58B434|nr:SMC family ATPase [Bacillus sp. MCCB 382]
MKLKRLIIESFRGFNEKKEFVFENSQLVLLYGPNGHGKTSFFDSFEWVLTGKINRYDDSSDERNRSKFVGNTFSSIPPFVQVVLAEKEKEYVITRIGIIDDSKTDYGKSTLRVEIKGEVCFREDYAAKYLSKLLINNEWIDKINQENLNNIFNLTHYSSQEKLNHFLRGAKEGDRYDALSTILGTEQYNHYKEKFKLVHKRLNSDVEEIRENLREAQIKEDGLKNDIDDLKKNANKYDYDLHKAKRLLVEYNKLFNKELNLNSNAETLLKMIHKDNSNLFKEKNLIEKRFQKVSELYRDLDKYNLIFDNLAANKAKVNTLERIQDLDEKLIDFNWMEANFLDFQEGKKDLINKERSKYEAQKEIEKLSLYISKLETFYMNAVNNLEQSIEQSEFKELKNFININVNNLNLKEKLINQLDQVAKSLNDLEVKEHELGILKKIKEEDQNFLTNLEKVDEKYSSLLRKVLSFVETADSVDSCPVCGNENVTSEYLVNFAKRAQKDVNLNIPIALERYNTSQRNYTRGEEEYKNNKKIYMENVSKFKLEIERVADNILKQKEKLSNLYIELNRLSKTLSIIEDNNSQFSNHMAKYKLEIATLNDITDSIEKIKDEKTKLLRNNKVQENKDIKIIKRNIESNNIFLENFNSRMSHVDSKINNFDDPHYVSELVIEKFNEYEKQKAFLNSKTNILELLIKEMENLKTSTILSKKEKTLESSKITIKSLQQQINGLNDKISILEGVIKSVPLAIEDLNEQSIEELFVLVQQIYSKLNSHPIFNKLNFKTEKRYGNFKLLLSVLSDDDMGANPSFIYSAAQVNTIALSLFLSMAIMQEWSNLNIIALDDPIQSMDSLNSLAFIDLLRRITDQKTYNKQLFISTHDSSFYELMLKKFQQFDLAIIKFNGYSKFGPTFGDLVNGKNSNGDPIEIRKSIKVENFNELVLKL